MARSGFNEKRGRGDAMARRMFEASSWVVPPEIFAGVVLVMGTVGD